MQFDFSSLFNKDANNIKRNNPITLNLESQKIIKINLIKNFDMWVISHKIIKNNLN